jgi:cytochrome P450
MQVVRRPPGPPDTWNMSTMLSSPLDFLRMITAEYGDITSHDIEGETVYIANRPDLAREILHDRFANFVKAGTPDQMMLSPLLGEGLLTSDGEVWERQRRMCAPAFRPAQVDTFDAIMTDAAQALLRRWQPAIEDGTPVRLDHDLTALTLTVVVRAMIGFDMSGAGAGFGKAVDAVNRHMGHYQIYDVDSTDAARSRAQFDRGRSFLDGIVRTLIAARRAVGGDEHNLLAPLLALGAAMRDDELRDQVLTIVMAGHETTAKSLTWTLYLLDQHPDVAATVVDEVDRVLGGRAPTASDVAALPYTRSVLDEAMRLYPPVWLISRRTVADDELGSYDVPAGTLVCISPYTLHRHPAYWDDPERFDPKRFAPGADADRPSHLYLPFGGGPRLCIGRQFALTEAVLVLATLLQSVQLGLVPGQDVQPEALVTLRPRDGIYVIPRRR